MKTSLLLAVIGGCALSSHALADDLSNRLTGLQTRAIAEAEMDGLHARYLYDTYAFFAANLDQSPPTAGAWALLNTASNSFYEPAGGSFASGADWEFVADWLMVPTPLMNTPFGNISAINTCRSANSPACTAQAQSNLQNILP